MDKFIVAEISKSWSGNFDENTPLSQLIQNKFEDVINVNYKRGYNLQGWQFSNTYNPDRLELNETIIAVFVREKDYIITTKGTQKCITCLDCEKTSYNTNDIENLYCGHCHKFHQISLGYNTKRIKINHGTATVDINCPQKTIDLLNELSDKVYNMDPGKTKEES